MGMVFRIFLSSSFISVKVRGVLLVGRWFVKWKSDIEMEMCCVFMSFDDFPGCKVT